MVKYITVALNESEEEFKMPLEQDNTLLLSVVQSVFPDAVGLKFKVGSIVHILRFSNGKFYFPTDAFDDSDNFIYYCISSKGKKSNDEAICPQHVKSKPEKLLKKTPIDEYCQNIRQFCVENSDKSDGIWLLLAFASQKFAEKETERDFRDKKLSNLELIVIYRSIIEMTEKFFLGRKRRDLQSMSREQRWEKILSLEDDAAVVSLLELINKDEQLSKSNFPSYVANAYTYFSTSIHSYVHEKKKFYLNEFDQLPGYIFGRRNAKRVIQILFQINDSLAATLVSSSPINSASNSKEKLINTHITDFGDEDDPDELDHTPSGISKLVEKSMECLANIENENLSDSGSPPDVRRFQRKRETPLDEKTQNKPEIVKKRRSRVRGKKISADASQ